MDNAQDVKGEKLGGEDKSAEKCTKVKAVLWLNDKDDSVFEYVLAAKMSDAEVLELRSLAKMKKRLNWPLWENAIKEELETLRVVGT